MKKSTRFLVVCVVFIVQVHIVYAQEYYEWRNGEKVTLEPVQNEWVMHAVPDAKEKADSILSYTPVSITMVHKETNNQNYWVHARDVSNTERSVLASQDKNLHIVPLFKVGEDEFKHPSRKIRIEWVGHLSASEIEQITKTYRLKKDTSFTAKWIPDAAFYLVTPPFDKTSLETANELVEQGYAKRANTVMTYWIKALQVSPNDEHYGNQWHLPKTLANNAWDVTTGQGTLFAIMDDGVDLTHDDLNDNLLRDGQGQIISANFTDVGGNTAQPHFPEDAHGTNCVGIAAAVTNNTDGVAGASWNSSILGIRVSHRHPDPYYASLGYIVIEPGWAEAAINFASNHNADVLSISLGLGDPAFETAMEDNLSSARNNGVVIVAASGNHLQGQSTAVSYPASSAYTIAVGATNPDDERKHLNDGHEYWWGSNYGNELNLTAPGVFMYSTDISGSDGYIDNTGDDPDFNPAFNGTSSATPLVGGVVALMRSVNPSLTPTQIQTILENTADEVGPYTYSGGFNQNMGHGRLNAYRAVKASLPHQYNSQNFSSSTTLSNSAHIYGSTSIGSSVTVIIPSNEVVVLRGTVNGSTSSKIKSNGKLIIESGTTLNDVEVVIENGGELIANSVTFDGKGIVFNSGSDGQITGSTIKNANRGIELNGNTTPLIRGNAIEDNSTGVWVNSGVGSGAKIINNTIQSNSLNGIASYYSSPTIQYNFVIGGGNNFFGIGSSATFYYNQFRGTYNGIYLLNNSAVQSMTYNQIYGPNHENIHVESPVTVIVGQNDIIPITGGGTDYLIRAKYNATVIAYNNYFAAATSSLFYATDGANIYYSNASNPFLPQYLKAGNPELASSEYMPELDCSQQYEEVSTILLAESNKEETRRNLLSTKAGCWRATGKTGFIDWLNKEMRPGLSKNSKLFATTLELENLFLMDQGKYDEVIANYQILRKNFAGDPLLHQHALFGLGYIHSVVNNDTKAGGNYLAELQQRYPESSLTQQAESLAEAYSFKIARLDDFEAFEEAEKGKEALSLSNYPNPFNPVTEISYSLPERSQVSLVVYDMLGRQVAELVNQQQSAGTHNISFDASQLSSGIYLYRLQVGSKVITERMTLLK